MQKDYLIREIPSAKLELSRFMSMVYLWMTIGLIITASIAAYVSSSNELLYALASNPLLFYGCIIMELVLVMWLSAKAHTMEPAMVTGMFIIYAVLNGVTLSVISLVYTQESILSAFITSSFSFAGLSLFGLVTKRDLGPVGNFCTMGLFGMIGFALLSWIFPGMMTSFTSKIFGLAGIIVFAGLTAYDTQRIKDLAPQNEGGAQGFAIMGALKLYLDFINLFLAILRVMGGRR
jgi:uncharacterized protein